MMPTISEKPVIISAIIDVKRLVGEKTEAASMAVAR